MPDEESSRQRSAIIIVHAEQNSQLAMRCSRPEEESYRQPLSSFYVRIATPDTRK
ncbi:hypothetical protein A2U01_0084414, partial [Trifolium medium]|nr:hypothetical protein [Trifolium medium]